jgi:hypothetical protein
MTIQKPLFNINWLDFVWLWATSAEQTETGNGLEVFPNPTQDFISLRETLSETRDVEIQICDLVGHTPIKDRLYQVRKINKAIDFNQPPCGMYFLILSLEDGTLHVENFLKPGD